MGSTGTSAGMMSSVENIRVASDYVGDRNIENQINDYIRNHLGENEEYASVRDFEIISNPGGGDVGDVRATYEVKIAMPYTQYDSDGTSYEVTERETEYRTDVFQVRLRK